MCWLTWLCIRQNFHLPASLHHPSVDAIIAATHWPPLFQFYSTSSCLPVLVCNRDGSCRVLFVGVFLFFLSYQPLQVWNAVSTVLCGTACCMRLGNSGNTVGGLQ